MFTFPHCDVPLDSIIGLFTKDHDWDDVEYLIACDEKHADGEQHRHVLVKYISSHNMGRKAQAYLFDIVKSWDVKEDTSADNINYCFISDMYHKDDIECDADWIPQPGKDVEDKFIKGSFLRRWHPNIQAVKSPKDAVKYVKKDGEWKEYGRCPWNIKYSKQELNKLLLTHDLNSLVDEGIISLFSLANLKKQ